MSIDLSQIGKNTERHLVKSSEVEKKQTPKKLGKEIKRGRPQIDEALLNQKVTVNLTENEKKKLEERANGIPLTKYIRDFLKKGKII